MEKKRAKGEMFLKVSGIILILPGILRIIVTFGFTTILVVTAQMTGEGGAARWILMGILSLAGGGTGVTAGILGLKYGERPEKGGVCLGWSIAAAVLCLMNYFNLVLTVISLIPVAFYIAGANMNRKEQQVIELLQASGHKN